MSEASGATGWRDLVAEYDQDAHDKMVEYIGHIVGDDSIPAVFRELILFSASTCIRFKPSMKTHAQRALDQGATDRQLFQAAALASLTGGFTCMIEAMHILQELGVDVSD